MSSLVPLHTMTPQDALRVLASSPRGLSTAEAALRLRDAQTWRVKPPKPTAVIRVLGRQLFNPFVFVMGVAMLISWWSGHVFDALITFAIIIANATLGFFQEFRADRAFFALQQYLPTLVNVRRDNVVLSLAADLLVPGDIMILRAGQNIVADGRVLEASNLSVSEAALSGESSPIQKQIESCARDAGIFDRRNMVYAGTSVMTGQGTVVVHAIGTQSEFGKIGTLTSGVVSQETPLEGETRRLARLLSVVVVCIAIGIIVLTSSRDIDLVTSLTLAAALAIAVIPQGLPMTLTVLLSAAMHRMLKRGVLVRHLAATETLGSVNVLCVDKTGTLTTGVMSVVEVQNLEGIQQKKNVMNGEIGTALSAIATQHRSAGDVAFAGASTMGSVVTYVGNALETPCSAMLPFDAAYRYSACRIGTKTTYVMGAPDALIPLLAGLHERKSVQDMVGDMAGRGLRVLFVGSCETQGSLNPQSIANVRLLACVGIEDPLRSSVPGAIALAERAGIRTIMMTGDHPETAKSIGAQAFDHRKLTVMLGADFVKYSAADRLRVVREVNIFARMLPEHKLLVVEALHANGLRVAMTGDGVNDAPALKAADVGIAVGHATEVAKEASDLVLIDGDFGNIVHAIAEGRAVFENTRSVTVFLLALGLGEVYCIVVSFLLFLPLPLTPLLILWLNLVTDGIPGLFFAFEGAHPTAMQEPPRSANEGIISPHVRSFFLAAAIGLFVIVWCAFMTIRFVNLSEIETRSITYLAIGAMGLLFIFVTKSFHQSFFGNLFTPSALRIGAAIGTLCLLAPFLTPGLRAAFGLVWPTWSLVGAMSVILLIAFVFLETMKRRFSSPDILPPYGSLQHPQFSGRSRNGDGSRAV